MSDRNGFVVRQCETFEPELNFRNFDEFMEFAYQGGWLTALLAMNQAGSASELRAATQAWHVPTFTIVYADVAGHIAPFAAEHGGDIGGMPRGLNGPKDAD